MARYLLCEIIQGAIAAERVAQKTYTKPPTAVLSMSFASSFSDNISGIYYSTS